MTSHIIVQTQTSSDSLQKTSPGRSFDLSDQPIFRACRNGDASWVEHLLEVCPDCSHETDKNGRIPIHEACLRGRLDVVRLISGQPNASLSRTDFDGNTPLHDACRGGSADIVKLLLEHRSSQHLPVPLWNIRNCRGHILLHEAARSGSVETVDVLLQYDSANYNGLRKMDNAGMFPLHHACAAGGLSTVRRILQGLKKGAFQMKDKRGMFPLDHAHEAGGSPELIKFLVEQHPPENTAPGMPCHCKPRHDPKKLVSYRLLLMISACIRPFQKHGAAAGNGARCRGAVRSFFLTVLAWFGGGGGKKYTQPSK